MRPGVVAEDTAIQAMAQGVVSTRFDDARPLESVTIPADARTVRYETRAGLRLDVTLAAADGATWVVYEVGIVEGTDGAAALAAEINERTSRWAFRLPAGRIATLATDVARLVTVPPAVTPLFPVPPRP